MRYFIPCLMLTVALGQFFFSQNGLSRWKGGGYGMYSEIHPQEYKLFTSPYLNLDSAIRQKKLPPKALHELDLCEDRMKIYPTAAHKKSYFALLAKYIDTTCITFEIRKPCIHLDSCLYGYLPISASKLD